jgi:hypothetical protein
MKCNGRRCFVVVVDGDALDTRLPFVCARCQLMTSKIQDSQIFLDLAHDDVIACTGWNRTPNNGAEKLRGQKRDKYCEKEPTPHTFFLV